ncbi:hypothetical protein [Desulfobotulus alkaliphilus]|uniref:hypothetical protein n=1 Tax=Desulfobotulus alkaliphilus TaxID=622671 RepID=UPI001C983CA5|nr:hypothetical protein [Desulfobotulus alkaliphilus]
MGQTPHFWTDDHTNTSEAFMKNLALSVNPIVGQRIPGYIAISVSSREPECWLTQGQTRNPQA